MIFDRKKNCRDENSDKMKKSYLVKLVLISLGMMNMYIVYRFMTLVVKNYKISKSFFQTIIHFVNF